MYDTELCTLCDLSVNGDEYHYIMICTYFRQSRELYLKHYFYTRPNMFKIRSIIENKLTMSSLTLLLWYNSKNPLHFIIVYMLFSAISIISFYVYNVCI